MASNSSNSLQSEIETEAGAVPSGGNLPEESSKTESKERVGGEEDIGIQQSQQGEKQNLHVTAQSPNVQLEPQGSKSTSVGTSEHGSTEAEGENLPSKHQLQQAEANSFLFVEKEPAHAVGQSSGSATMEISQSSENQQQQMQQMSSQQAADGSQPSSPMGRTNLTPSIPFNMLIPILRAHLDKDKDMQLQSVWAKLRSNEVHKNDFLRVIRNIVGDRMLKQAAHKVYSQMQVQAQRNVQTNPNQNFLASQVSSQQLPSGTSKQLAEQQGFPPVIANQVQTSQTSPSPCPPASVVQMQTVTGIRATDGQIQRPDAMGMHAMPNRPAITSSVVSLQQNAKAPRASQPMYGSNPRAPAYPRPISGPSASVRPPNLGSQTRPPPLTPRIIPANTGPVAARPGLQQRTPVPWQIAENQANVFPPVAHLKQEIGDHSAEPAQKSQYISPGNSSLGPPHTTQLNPALGSTNYSSSRVGAPSASLNSNHMAGPRAVQAQPIIQNSSTTPAPAGANIKTPQKKSAVGQKKQLEAIGSSPSPSSKRQKTSGASHDQSIDQLNDVTAISGVNLKEEEEQLLSASKEDSRISEATRRVVQEEEEKMILQKGPLMKKLAEIMSKCNLKNISRDVERCLSMCVEERLRGLLRSLIRLSKQRIDTEKQGHRFVITSDVRRQILMMNRKAKEEWDKKQAEAAQKLRRQTEPEGNAGADPEKDGDDGRTKNIKPNKDEDDKMRTTAANVAARAAVGGDDMLSKWQLMARRAEEKRKELGGPSASPPVTPPVTKPTPRVEKGSSENQGAAKRAHPVSHGSGGMRRPGRSQSVLPHRKVQQRSISVKDVISVLEREPQMSKSPLIYRLYERLPGDATTQ